MNFAAKLASKKDAPPKEKEVIKEDAVVTERAVVAKTAHAEALAKGIKCYRDLRLRQIVLKDGKPVKPTEEGIFIAFSPEVAEQLAFFAAHRPGYLEEITE